ncbi:hypothetical protein BpHYR1_024609 [Brachionus plicatilis]|uniref:Uncharacterized protein n=1 Tax=Brachionus plicatilis TaxID=10195 RepID=A0A3M7SRE0_BRAPC|nr:hypothetical protein BpHYR1_024609 [Brachionus plicatilis]
MSLSMSSSFKNLSTSTKSSIGICAKQINSTFYEKILIFNHVIVEFLNISLFDSVDYFGKRFQVIF